MERPDIENIKNMYNDAPIVFIQGARQAIPQLIDYIEQLEKQIKMFREDTIESIEKGKLRNIELDLITDKVKELVERNKALEQNVKLALGEAITIIYLNDNSDYLFALWNIVRILNPEAADLLENNESLAVDKYGELDGDKQ